jgi:hypothetical protein
MSLSNAAGLSTAAKCPPDLCCRKKTRSPVVAAQLLGIGAISFGNQEKPNGLLICHLGFSWAPIFPGVKNCAHGVELVMFKMSSPRSEEKANLTIWIDRGREGLGHPVKRDGF